MDDIEAAVSKVLNDYENSPAAAATAPVAPVASNSRMTAAQLARITNQAKASANRATRATGSRATPAPRAARSQAAQPQTTTIVAPVQPLPDDISSPTLTMDPVAEPVASQRGPGRPRKYQTSQPRIVVHGIIEQPSNTADIVEMQYHNPMIFKKLIGLLKSYGVSEIEVIFTKDGMKIRAIDHSNKSDIYVEAIGKAMVLYYCDKPIVIRVQRSSLERAIGSINKDHVAITFLLRNDCKQNLFCVLKNGKLGSDDRYSIPALSYTHDIQPPVANDDSQYPIRFTLSASTFKNIINNAKKFSDTFMIQKSGTKPLQIRVESDDRASYESSYSDDSAIGLVSNIAKDEIFSVGITSAYVKQFSDNPVGEMVTICADARRKLSISSQAGSYNGDPVFNIKVFIQVK